MTPENSRDRFVMVSNLARTVAEDSSSISEIGLDGFAHDQIVQGLEMVFG